MYMYVYIYIYTGALMCEAPILSTVPMLIVTHGNDSSGRVCVRYTLRCNPAESDNGLVKLMEASRLFSAVKHSTHTAHVHLCIPHVQSGPTLGAEQ